MREWSKEERERLESLCKKAVSWKELKREAKQTFKNRTWHSIRAMIWKYQWANHLDKFKRKWDQDALIRLENLCKEAGSLRELELKAREVFKDRTWDAIKRILYENPDWTEHLTKSKKEEEDILALPPEELKPKLDRLLEILKEGPSTVTAISEDPQIDIPKEDVWPLIDKLREKGYDIIEEKRKVFLREEPIPGVSPSLPSTTKRSRIEVLFLSDCCLGLKTQQGDLLKTCIEIGEQRGVWFSVIAGNLVAGKPLRGREEEYFLKTPKEQAEYVISHFPEASFKHYFINGPRELSFKKDKKGINIESLICKERPDIRYLGDEKKVIPIGWPHTKVAVVNAGETQAYTKSYTLQGVMENFQEAVHYIFEHSEPLQAIVVGGLYSGILIPRQLPIKLSRYNDFDGVAVPALYRITPSQTARRKRGGSPVLGCLILGGNFDKGKFLGFTYAFYDLTAYFKDDDYLEEIKIENDLDEEERRILLKLKKGPARYGELSGVIRKSIPHVEKVIESLRSKGYDIFFSEARKALELRRPFKEKFESLDLNKLLVHSVRFLALSDTHLGHRGERPDIIKKAYQIAEEKKVDLVLHCGNLLEGTYSYEEQPQDLIYFGADQQRKHALEIWPKSKIPTVFISSPRKEHDRIFWSRSGYDVVENFVEIARYQGYSFHYLGGARGIVKIKDIEIDLQHPSGGLPYGQTYRLQRRIEMLASAMELVKGAKATFVGHFHRAAALLYKGIFGCLVPACQEQTGYIDSIDKLAELGVWIVELGFDEKKNLVKVELEYVPFEPQPEGTRYLDLDQEFSKKWQT